PHNHAFHAHDAEQPELAALVHDVDAAIQKLWQEYDPEHPLRPAAPASDLAVARRLSLALVGTIPSLQEIRQFEGRPGKDRLNWYTAQLLDDRRHADYFAERLARAYVGTENGPFVVYRRR